MTPPLSTELGLELSVHQSCIPHREESHHRKIKQKRPTESVQPNYLVSREGETAAEKKHHHQEVQKYGTQRHLFECANIPPSIQILK